MLKCQIYVVNMKSDLLHVYNIYVHIKYGIFVDTLNNMIYIRYIDQTCTYIIYVVHTHINVGSIDIVTSILIRNRQYYSGMVI